MPEGTRWVIPRADGEGNFGNSSRYWKDIYTNYLRLSDGSITRTANLVNDVFQNFAIFPTSGSWYDIHLLASSGPSQSVTFDHNLGTIPKTVSLLVRKQSTLDVHVLDFVTPGNRSQVTMYAYALDVRLTTTQAFISTGDYFRNDDWFVIYQGSKTTIQTYDSEIQIGFFI